MTIGRSGAAREAIDRLGVVADRLQHPLAGRLPGMLAMNLAWGPTPVAEALDATARMLQTVRDDPAAEPFVLAGHAYLLAQAGDIDGSAKGARPDARDGRATGPAHRPVGVVGSERRPHRVAGGRSGARGAGLRPSYHALPEAGSHAFSATLGGQLAHALVDLGRHGEAATYAAAARDVAGEADVLSQVLWRSGLARARSSKASAEEPAELVDEAVRLAGSTEWPNVIADSLLDRAHVLRGMRRASMRPRSARTSSARAWYTSPRETRPGARRQSPSRRALGRKGMPHKREEGAGDRTSRHQVCC